MTRITALVLTLALSAAHRAGAQTVADSIQSLASRVSHLETQRAAPAPSATDVVIAGTTVAGLSTTTFGGTLALSNRAGNIRAKGDQWVNGGFFETWNSTGNSVAWLGSSSTAAGLVQLSNPSGTVTAKLAAGGNGTLQLFDAVGAFRLKMDIWANGGFVEALNSSGQTVVWVGSSTGNEGIVELRNKQNKAVAKLNTDNTGNGILNLSNNGGTLGVSLNTGGEGDQGGWAEFFNQSGTRVVYLGVNKSGQGSLTVDGKNVGDYSEWFEVTDETVVTPGSVVCSTGAGQLRPCDEAFAPTTVGVVSGAGPLTAGVVLGAAGDDRTQVAMAGQVYVQCKLVDGFVRVGDLLVAGGDNGVAMPVRGIAPPAGTVVGKALETRTGQAGDVVLVRMLVLNR